MKAIKTFLVVVGTVVLILVGLLACAIHFGIWFSRPLNTPLDRPSTYSNSLWVAEDGKYAFVADDDGDLFGYGPESDSILNFRIGGYSDELAGHQFEIFSTGKSRLSDAMKVANRRWNHGSRELLITGSALSIGPTDDVIEVKIDGKVIIRFEQHELSEEFSFEDTPEWPEEMMEWIEQQSG